MDRNTGNSSETKSGPKLNLDLISIADISTTSFTTTLSSRSKESQSLTPSKLMINITPNTVQLNRSSCQFFLRPRERSTNLPTIKPTRKNKGAAMRIQINPSNNKIPNNNKAKAIPFITTPVTVEGRGVSDKAMANTKGNPINIRAVCSTRPNTMSRYTTEAAAIDKQTTTHGQLFLGGLISTRGSGRSFTSGAW